MSSAGQVCARKTVNSISKTKGPIYFEKGGTLTKFPWVGDYNVPLRLSAHDFARFLDSQIEINAQHLCFIFPFFSVDLRFLT